MRIAAMSLGALGFALAAQLTLAQTTPPGGDADIRPGHVPGVGPSYPLSPKASNITAADSRTPIAPTPPAPDLPPDASVGQMLRAASQDIAAGQTGTGDEALEEAETALLQRSVPQTQTNYLSNDPVVAQIGQARDALGAHDKTGAVRIINQILASNAAELNG